MFALLACDIDNAYMAGSTLALVAMRGKKEEIHGSLYIVHVPNTRNQLNDIATWRQHGEERKENLVVMCGPNKGTRAQRLHPNKV